MSRRGWVVAAALVVLLLVGALVVVRRVLPSCGDAVTERSAADSSSPFLDARERRQRPDADRDRLTDTLAADPAPVGPVLGAVGYHYEQWAQLSAYARGIGVRTRDNPDFTLLDDRTLRPRWSVEVDTRRSTYDADDRTYLVTTMPTDGPPNLVALDLASGRRRWCHTLGERPVPAGAAFATSLLPGGDLVALAPAGRGRVRLTRVSGRQGELSWQRVVRAGSGEFLGTLGPDLLVAGGRAGFGLFDGSVARRRAGTSLTAVSTRDGTPVWEHEEPAGSDLHVLGTDAASGRIFVQQYSTRTRAARLIALDEQGHRAWSTEPARGAPFDAAVRGRQVLVRAGSRWSAYAVDGRLLWSRTLRSRPQLLPYGFALEEVPLLDEDHVLVGATDALITLDLRTGATASVRLPTDGVATTYWPYQVAVSPRLLAVATNTGAVVVRRDPAVLPGW